MLREQRGKADQEERAASYEPCRASAQRAACEESKAGRDDQEPEADFVAEFRREGDGFVAFEVGEPESPEPRREGLNELGGGTNGGVCVSRE